MITTTTLLLLTYNFNVSLVQASLYSPKFPIFLSDIHTKNKASRFRSLLIDHTLLNRKQCSAVAEFQWQYFQADPILYS